MERFRDRDLIVLGLNREEDRDAEETVARELGMDYPVLLGMQDAFAAYWVEGIPDTILIDREGRVVRRWTGFHEGVVEEIEAAVEKALGVRRGPG